MALRVKFFHSLFSLPSHIDISQRGDFNHHILHHIWVLECWLVWKPLEPSEVQIKFGVFLLEAQDDSEGLDEIGCQLELRGFKYLGGYGLKGS